MMHEDPPEETGDEGPSGPRMEEQGTSAGSDLADPPGNEAETGDGYGFPRFRGIGEDDDQSEPEEEDEERFALGNLRPLRAEDRWEVASGNLTFPEQFSADGKVANRIELIALADKEDDGPIRNALVDRFAAGQPGAAPGSAPALWHCRVHGVDQVFLDDVVEAICNRLAEAADDAARKAELRGVQTGNPAEGGGDSQPSIVLVQLAGLPLALDDGQLADLLEDLQAHNASLVLMGTRLPARLGEAQCLEPNLLDHWLRRFLADNMAEQDVATLDAAFAALWAELSRHQIARPRDLRELLLSGDPWQDQDTPAEAFDRLFLEYQNQDAEVRNSLALVQKVFPDAAPADPLEFDLDLDSVLQEAAPKEPFASVLFTLWACLRTSNENAVRRQSFETALEMVVRGRADAEQAETQKRLAALTEEADAEARRTLVDHKGEFTKLLEMLDGKLDALYPRLYVRVDRNDSQVQVLSLRTEAMMDRLSKLMDGANAGYRQAEARRILAEPGVLLHEDATVRRMAAGHLIENFEGLGALGDDGALNRAVRDLCESFGLERRKWSRPGINGLVRVVQLWVWRDSRVHNTARLGRDRARDVVTALFRLLVRQSPHQAVLALFREIALARGRLELLDLPVLLDLFARSGNWDLVLGVLDLIERGLASTRPGARELQYLLFDYLVTRLGEERDHSSIEQLFLAGLAVRVVGGLGRRLRWRDYRPAAEDGSWEPLLERILERDQGVEEIVLLLSHPLVRDHLRKVVGTAASSLLDKDWGSLHAMLREVKVLETQVNLMNLVLPDMDGLDMDALTEEMWRSQMGLAKGADTTRASASDPDELSGDGAQKAGPNTSRGSPPEGETERQGFGPVNFSSASEFWKGGGAGRAPSDEALEQVKTWVGGLPDLVPLLGSLDLFLGLELFAAFDLSDRHALRDRLGDAFRAQEGSDAWSRLEPVLLLRLTQFSEIDLQLDIEAQDDPNLAPDVKFARGFLKTRASAMERFSV